MLDKFKSLGSWFASFLRKPEVKAGLKAGATAAATAYAGPVGAKAVEIVGPKVLDGVTRAVDPNEKLF